MAGGAVSGCKPAARPPGRGEAGLLMAEIKFSLNAASYEKKRCAGALVGRGAELSSDRPPPPVQIKTIVSEQLQLPALLQLSISITIYNNSYVIQDTKIYFILK